MSQEHIINSAHVIVDKMHGLFNDGKPGSADVDYKLLQNNLLNILSTNESEEETTKHVEGLIHKMSEYENLGVILRGEFNPISPSLAARNRLAPGRFLGGMRFLVVTKEFAKQLLGNKDVVIPDNVMWSEMDSSLVHIGYYYRSHPEQIQDLSMAEIEKLNLNEAFNDFVLSNKG